MSSTDTMVRVPLALACRRLRCADCARNVLLVNARLERCCREAAAHGDALHDVAGAAACIIVLLDTSAV